ncbi:MAG: ribosome maturation factor RimM, partial [Phenylobacterium sp.]
MTADLILVARVAGAFGVKGEVRLTAFTADPMALVGYRELLREDGSPGLTLAAGRVAKAGLVARAREVETREQAEALRGLSLYIPRDRLPPPEEDEFYLADLIGLAVETAEGEALGTVRSV